MSTEKAPRCDHCGKPIINGLPVKYGDEQFHLECT